MGRSGGHRRIAYMVACDLDREGLQVFSVDAKVDLAPDPSLGPPCRCARMAASLRVHCRRRLPVDAAIQVILGSNEIVSEQRRLSVFSQADQFLVLQVGGAGLLMPPGHHAEFSR